MAVPRDPPNPWVLPIPDNFGKMFSLTWHWDTVTRDVVRLDVFREEGCQWEKAYVGLGPDGRPNSTPKQFNIGKLVGTIQFDQTDLRHPTINLRVIDDVTALQITAGP